MNSSIRNDHRQETQHEGGIERNKRETRKPVQGTALDINHSDLGQQGEIERAEGTQSTRGNEDEMMSQNVVEKHTRKITNPRVSHRDL